MCEEILRLGRRLSVLFLLAALACTPIVNDIPEAPDATEEQTDTPSEDSEEDNGEPSGEEETPPVDLILSGTAVDTLVFKDDPIVIPVSAIQSNADTLFVSGSMLEDCSVSFEYSREKKSGAVTYSSSGYRGKALLTLSDGVREADLLITSWTYFLEIVSETEMKISGEQAELTIQVSYNCDPEQLKVSCSDWMKILGYSNKSMRVSVGKNDTDAVRSGEVVMSFGKLEARCRIEQDFVEKNERVEGCVFFPDINFKHAVVEKFDSDGDREISYEEALWITELDIRDRDIYRLDGIEYLTNLESLSAEGNYIGSADLCLGGTMPHRHLRKISAFHGTPFDVRGCPTLVEIEFKDIESVDQEKESRRAEIISRLRKDIEAGWRSAVFAYEGQLVFARPSNSGILRFSDPYESVDYSRDGEVVRISTHSVGKGIDLVFIGDGYQDIDLDLYDEQMRRSAELFFSEEPYKSLRDRFDVSYVIAVSARHCNYDDQHGWKHTALATQASSKLYSADCGKILGYVSFFDRKWVTVSPLSDLSSRSVRSQTTTEKGASIGFCVWSPEDEPYAGRLLHETGGHGIADLVDEYVENTTKTKTGTTDPYSNVSYTDDPEKVPWARMLSLDAYKDQVGIYQGGAHYLHGVWRSSETSVMRDNATCRSFNAWSRFLIYRRVMILSGEYQSAPAGDPEEAVWKGFVERDNM